MVTKQTSTEETLVRLPPPKPAQALFEGRQPDKPAGRIIDFQQWSNMKNQASSSPIDELTYEEREVMTTGEKLIRLMDLVSRDETDDEMIDRILEAAEAIVRGENQGKLG